MRLNQLYTESVDDTQIIKLNRCSTCGEPLIKNTCPECDVSKEKETPKKKGGTQKMPSVDEND